LVAEALHANPAQPNDSACEELPLNEIALAGNYGRESLVGRDSGDGVRG